MKRLEPGYLVMRRHTEDTLHVILILLFVHRHTLYSRIFLFSHSHLALFFQFDPFIVYLSFLINKQTRRYLSNF